MNQRSSRPAASNSENVGRQRTNGAAVPTASQHVDSDIVNLHDEIASLRALWAHAQHRLDRERELRATDRALLASSLAEIAAIRNSKSWKIVAPVRALNRLARRLMG
jgi:hypothetical protein